MSKDPAFLFYYENYSHGTRFFTFEQKGAYMDLLIEQADNYNLAIETIKEILKEKFDELWPVIKSKFKKDRNGHFFNERLRQEQQKRKNYSESRRINRTKSKIKPQKHMNNISERYDKHMEDKDKDKDKNRDKDRDKNKVYKVRVLGDGKYNPITDCSFFNDTDFKEAWQSWNIVRQKKKCSNSDRAIKMAVNKLMGLSVGDKVKAIQILDQSAHKGYSDLYELKEDGLSFKERYRKASE